MYIGLENTLKKLLAAITLLAPLAALASEDACKEITLVIERDYEVTKLEPLGSGIFGTTTMCNYSGTKDEQMVLIMARMDDHKPTIQILDFFDAMMDHY